MGGRGASSGKSDKGKTYGTEYRTLLEDGRVKFVEYNDSKSAKAPMETMSKGRIYVTVDNNARLRNLVYFDEHNKRYKQVDIEGHKHTVEGQKISPHTHIGYLHDEGGTRALTTNERATLDKVQKLWENYQQQR